MKPTTHKTKVSEAGRGTYLIWQRVKHAGAYIVGHFQDNAGLYTKPRLWSTQVSAGGQEFITTSEYGRIYLNADYRNRRK